MSVRAAVRGIVAGALLLLVGVLLGWVALAPVLAVLTLATLVFAGEILIALGSSAPPHASAARTRSREALVDTSALID